MNRIHGASSGRAFSPVLTAGGIAAAAALLIGVPTAAHAQSSVVTEQEHPFSVSIGTYIPTSQAARDAGGDALIALEGSYLLPFVPNPNSRVKLNLGYIDRDDLRIIPLTLSEVFQDYSISTGARYSYSFGIGGYNVRLRLTDNFGTTTNDSKWLLGGFAGASINLSESFFAEAKYHYIGEYNNKFVGGFQLSAGYRF